MQQRTAREMIPWRCFQRSKKTVFEMAVAYHFMTYSVTGVAYSLAGLRGVQSPVTALRG